MPDTILHVIRYEDPSVGCVHLYFPRRISKEIVPKLEPVLAKPFTQIFLGAVSGA
jgi:hypothetical protein